MPRGVMIVFEGAEGAGKSTQLRLVADWLTAAGKPVVTVREPGGTAVGDEIRRIVLDTDLEIVPRAEALLFMASRAQLVDSMIRPALDRGDIVLVDRFFLSTYAYQGGGRGLPEELIANGNRFATDGLVPDLTLLVTIRAAEGLARAMRRSAHDRIERVELAFHERVARAFERFATPEWQRAHPECGPIQTVDGSGTEGAVFDRVLSALRSRWPELIPQSSHVA